MPSRVNKLYRTLDSAPVQGEGSWVKVKAPTLEDVRQFSLPAEGDTGGALEFGKNMLGKLVIAWNWVDDDDKPLPEPTPEIVAGLPYAEVQFLMEQLDLAGIADTKN